MLKSVKSKLSGVGRKNPRAGRPRRRPGDLRVLGRYPDPGHRPPVLDRVPRKTRARAPGTYLPWRFCTIRTSRFFLFRDVVASERQNLFVKKLQLCSYTFDFTDATANVREKEIKRQTLLELVDYVNQGQGKFTEVVFEDISYMLAQNLFRGLPPSNHEITGSAAGRQL